MRSNKKEQLDQLTVQLSEARRVLALKIKEVCDLMDKQHHELKEVEDQRWAAEEYVDDLTLKIAKLMKGAFFQRQARAILAKRKDWAECRPVVEKILADIEKRIHAPPPQNKPISLSSFRKKRDRK